MSVIVRIYDPPSEEIPRFTNQGLIMDCININTVERWWNPGYFTLQIATEARHADRLQVGRLVLIGGVFWGIIDDVELVASIDGDRLTVTGRQLKGLTADRITIPPGATDVVGAQGYDAQSGTTEAIMRHFVSANMGPEAAEIRRVYALELAPDSGRGIADDRYISRHDALSDVLAGLGEAAELGYDIVPDLAANKLTFTVQEGADHSAGQSNRTRVIFDVSRKTALGQEYSYANSDARNVFYATMGGEEFADQALTVTYIRDDEPEEPIGIRRREQHLQLSVDTPTAGDEYAELRRMALIEAEHYRPADSFKCNLPSAGRYEYRKDYHLGDLVTVINSKWGVSMDARLTEMETNWGENGMTLSATFGKAPLNVFGLLARQIKAKK